MSAIAGIWAYEEGLAIQVTASDMLRALGDIPSDEALLWCRGPVGMGCLHQRITPESCRERIPYYHEVSRLAITADAILDNRSELCERLEIPHLREHSITDSELILAAYEAWGERSPERLLGDFAFVIWDERRQLLFGARDLLGSRTLYYRNDGGRFAFSTLIGPLLTLPGIAKRVDENWLAEFLAIPIVQDTVDAHASPYQGVSLLPPAHAFTVAAGRLRLLRYGMFEEPTRKLKLGSNAEYEEAFRDVFREAVRSRLRTFRQVGASLSGGLDSGSVVSLAAGELRQGGRTLRTYSYVPPADFTDWTPKRMVADESPYIGSVVRHIGDLEHRTMDFADRDTLTDIDELIAMMEGPYKYLENSFWLHGMMKQARMDEVGVLLNGGRGNYTISWGAPIDYFARLARGLRWAAMYRELRAYARMERVGRARLLKAVLRQSAPLAMRRLGGRESIPSLIHPDLAARTGVYEKLRGHDVGLAETMDDFTRRLYQFNGLSVSNHCGVSGTKMALPYGLVERDPTSDPRVIRFCLSLPYDQFVQNGEDRSIIRRAMKGYLPDAVRCNQRLRGVQGADWLHRLRRSWPSVVEEAERLCRDSSASSILHAEQIRRSIAVVGRACRPDMAFDPHARTILQSVIVYRFLRTVTS